MPNDLKTDALTTQIALLVRGGMPKPAAAESLGVSRSTMYRWRREDPDFSEKLDEAEAKYLDTLVTRANQIASDANDRMSANMVQFLLERRHPDWYGRRKETEVGVDDTAPAAGVDADPESDSGVLSIAALLQHAGVGEAPQGVQAEAHEVHSAQANGHTNGVPARTEP